MVVVPPRVSAHLAAPEEAAAVSQRDLASQAATLTDRDATQQARDEAARRLVSRGTAEANDLLLRVLTDPANQGGQLAVARAIASARSPDPTFIEPLGTILAARGNLTASVAQALANYKNNSAVVDRLTSFVTRDVRVPPEQRAAAVRAMGRMVDKRVAGTLIELLNTEPLGPVRNAAADALQDVTGLAEYGRDVQQWNTWWRNNQNASELDWARNLLVKNNQEVQSLKTQKEDLRDPLRNLLAELYQRTPEAERAKAMLGYLKMPQEDFRLAAVRVVYFEATTKGAAAVPEQIKETLRAMVGDSSTDVRMQVAQTLTAVNDAGAVQALLAQLSQEKDPAVKAAILGALGPTNDPSAVAGIVAALSDPTFTVSAAAATALREMAKELRRNPEQAGQVAEALRREYERTTQIGISAQPLRIAIVQAMAALGHPSFRSLFFVLADPEREPLAIRRAAYQGLKLIGDPAAVNRITQGLRDREPGVRLEAVDAMSIATFEEALGALEPMLWPEGIEKDPSVRAKAWSVLEGLFPKASPEALSRLAARCGDHNQKPWQASAYIAAIDKLDAAGQAEKTAALRQNLGETLMDLKRYDEAATAFRKALTYWDSVNAVQAVKEPARLSLMRAMLRGRKYSDAIGFAKGLIAEAPENEITMWGLVKAEIETLQRDRNWDAAIQLIDEAQGAGFSSGHRSILERMKNEVVRRDRTGGWNWLSPEDSLIVPDWGPSMFA